MIGQMVHYVLREGQCRAAVIVKVWTHETVNLYVFPDGSNDGPDYYTQRVDWKTSVRLNDEIHEVNTWHHLHD